jgi:intracellular sulfur oxidation DsrE/DsrF family protein
MHMTQRLGLALLLTLMTALPTLAADKQKVVYHLADEDKVSFVLNNMRNHIEGVGGPQNVQLVLVMHGQVVKAFADIDAVDRVRNSVKALQADGVEVDVCANSLKVNKLAMSDMLPGLVEASAGGVVRIAELQSQGYVYIRP